MGKQPFDEVPFEARIESQIEVSLLLSNNDASSPSISLHEAQWCHGDLHHL
jgi:hypothetical protein